MQHIEKRASRLPVGGRRRAPEGERLSEYFAADKGKQFVRRFELLAILTQFHKAQRQHRWYSRAWRWLTAKVGSGPVHAVEPPKGEQEDHREPH